MKYDTTVTVTAPAKLNISLNVVGEDGCGYHLLDGVMLAVDLHDTLTLSLEAGEGIQLACNRTGVPLDETNLAAKAARVFLKEWGEESFPGKLSIHIAKRIPMQAGMAGGSADAAAVLVGLNRMFGAAIPHSRLMELGLTLGADVPFCLLGGCARAQGRGERLEPLHLPEGAFLILKPRVGSDTADAFACYDRFEGTLQRPDVKAMLLALDQGDRQAAGQQMQNVFEQVCSFEKVGELVQSMKESGALGAALTGTGTAVAGWFAHESDAHDCLMSLPGHLFSSLEYMGIHYPAHHGACVVE